MSSTHSRSGECVPAISSLRQRVGAEADPCFGFDDVFDHRRIFPRVDVIDELGALVPEKPGVLELRRAFHDPSRY